MAKFDLMNMLKEVFDEDEKVTKTIKVSEMSSKVKNSLEEFVKANDEVFTAKQKLEAMHRRFWSAVEEETGNFGQMKLGKDEDGHATIEFLS